MDNKRILKRLFPLIFLIFGVNFLANKFFWYSSIWFFDMPMHFLGGLWVGLAALYFFSLGDNFGLSVFKILLFVLAVGIAWEVYEIVINDVLAQNAFNSLDTISDIFFDLAGGTFAILYFLKRIWLTNENALQ